MIRKILTFGDVPTGECREATRCNRRDDQAVVWDMLDTLIDTEHGVGLAAPQIGELVRIIVVSSEYHYPPLVMLNPVIIRHGQETMKAVEGCLSYPGRFLGIERWKIVDVEFSPSENADRRVNTFRDMEARIIQHEIDHLDGKCKVAEAQA